MGLNRLCCYGFDGLWMCSDRFGWVLIGLDGLGCVHMDWDGYGWAGMGWDKFGRVGLCPHGLGCISQTYCSLPM